MTNEEAASEAMVSLLKELQEVKEERDEFSDAHGEAQAIAHLLIEKVPLSNLDTGRVLSAVRDLVRELDRARDARAKTEGNNLELHRQLDELEIDRNHWKANHDEMARRNRLLIDRTDLPIPRRHIYNEWVDRYEAQQKEIENLKWQVKNWEAKEITRASCCLENENRVKELEQELKEAKDTIAHLFFSTGL